jgi:hypothetical protein
MADADFLSAPFFGGTSVGDPISIDKAPHGDRRHKHRPAIG